jgi:hypothetical protein
MLDLKKSIFGVLLKRQGQPNALTFYVIHALKFMFV